MNVTITQKERAYSEALAALARLEEDVTTYRRDVLEGRLLTMKEVEPFLRSVALAYFTKRDLDDAGVPLIGHTADVSGVQILGKSDGARETKLSIFVDPPGVTLRRRDSYQPEQYKAGDEVRATRSTMRGLALHQHTDFFSGTPDDPKRVTEILGLLKRVPVVPGSVLGALYSSASRLVACYHWDGNEALRFILTDAVPRSFAFRAETADHLGPLPFREVTMRIPAWVTPEELGEIYRTLRSRVLASPRQRERDPGERSLAAFTFVMQRDPRIVMSSEWKQEYSGAELPTWGRLVSEWNAFVRSEGQPDWEFADQTGLWKAVERVKQILFPTLRPIGVDEVVQVPLKSGGQDAAPVSGKEDGE